jgi:hypothetical protein
MLFNCNIEYACLLVTMRAACTVIGLNNLVIVVFQHANVEHNYSLERSTISLFLA